MSVRGVDFLYMSVRGVDFLYMSVRGVDFISVSMIFRVDFVGTVDGVFLIFVFHFIINFNLRKQRESTKHKYILKYEENKILILKK
jgi:hypothetical protein